MTTTVGRTRKGVNVSATGGMSSSTDVHTGGASYFFTRIKPRSNAGGHLHFKIRNLSRQDAVSYGSDKFGRMSALSTRGSTIDDYVKMSAGSDNETIFKEGLNLLDDVEYIKASSTAQKQRLVKIFHDRGIRRLPDGRLIEDVIVTKFPTVAP